MSSIVFHCSSEEKEETKNGVRNILKNHYFTSVYPNSNAQYDDEGETVYLARLEELMDSELCSINDIKDGFEFEFDSTEDAGFAITDNVYHTSMGYRDEGLTFLDPLFEMIVKAFPSISFEANTICEDKWVYEENEYSYDDSKLLKNGMILLDLDEQANTNDDVLNEEEQLVVDSIDFNTSIFSLAGFEYLDECNIKEIIESRGGTVKDKVTAAINYLVVPTLAITNSKTKKAAELLEKGKDIRIISLEECRKHMLSHDEKIFGKDGAIVAADYLFSIADGKITLERYIGECAEVVIPEAIGNYQVIAMGSRCFASNPMSGAYANISSVKIPGSIEIIPNNCFEYCGELLSAVLEEGVKAIDTDAFRGCKKLISLSVPKTVNSIGKSAFHDCKSLKSIYIPASVHTLNNCITGCDSLEEIVVDCANVKYDSRDNCNAVIETSTNTLVMGCKSTVIPESVTAIGDSALACLNSIVEIELPEGITEIGNSAFSSCFNLKSIKLPQSITKIGYYAFYFCRELKKVVLPFNLTEIHVSAFGNCESLTELVINDNLTEIKELDNAWKYNWRIKTFYGSSNSIAKAVAEARGGEYVEV